MNMLKSLSLVLLVSAVSFANAADVDAASIATPVAAPEVTTTKKVVITEEATEVVAPEMSDEVTRTVVIPATEVATTVTTPEAMVTKTVTVTDVAPEVSSVTEEVPAN